jgi:hypothetical protein
VKCPVFLNESAYGRLVSLPENAGWNKSAHLAQIDFGQGEEPAYVKLITTPHWPALANEAIGWHLAHACGITAPARAAILTAPRTFWEDCVNVRLPEGSPDTEFVAAWCTSRCGDDDQQTWLSLDEDTAALALFKTSAGRRIAAFGIWLHHPDQHNLNLLRKGNGDWAVIDHEMLFNGLCGNWRNPNPIFEPPPYLLEKLRKLTRHGRINARKESNYRSEMIEHADQHTNAAARAMPYLSDTLEAIEPPQTARSALPLIVDRSWHFWMRHILNKLV